VNFKEVAVLKMLNKKQIEKLWETKELKLDYKVPWRNCWYLTFKKGREFYLGRINYLKVEIKKREDDKFPYLEAAWILKINEPVKLEISKFSKFFEELSDIEYLSFEEMLKKEKEKERKMSDEEKKMLISRYMERITIASAKGNLNEAFWSADRLMDFTSSSALASFYYGMVLEAMGRLEEAICHFLRVIEEDKRALLAYVHLGFCLERREMVDVATKFYKEALKLAPDSELVKFHLGKALLELKRYEEAAKYLEEIVSSGAKNVEILNLLAVAYAFSRQVEKAYKIWKDIVDSGKATPAVIFNYAKACLNIGKIAEGLRYLESLREEVEDPNFRAMVEAVIKEISESEGMKNAKGLADYFEGKFGVRVEGLTEEVRKHVDIAELEKFLEKYDWDDYDLKVIRFEPEESDKDYEVENKVLSIYKQVWVRSKKFGRKLSNVLKKGIEKTRVEVKDMGKDTPVVIDRRDYTQMSEEDFKQIYEELMEMISEDPENAWYYYHLSRILDMNGREKEAFEFINKAVELEPDNPMFLYYKALFLERRGELKEALELLQRALIVDVDSELERIFEEIGFKKSDIYFAMGNILVRMDRIEEAVSVLKRGLEMDPKNPIAHFQLGACLEILKRYDEAKQHLINSIAIDPQFAYSYIKLGLVYYRQKLYEEAILNFEKGLALAPYITEGLYWLGELYYELGNKELAWQLWTAILNNSTPEDQFWKLAKMRIEELEGKAGPEGEGDVGNNSGGKGKKGATKKSASKKKRDENLKDSDKESGDNEKK